MIDKYLARFISKFSYCQDIFTNYLNVAFMAVLFAIVHFIFLIEFLVLGIYEMAMYNIFSVLFFLFIAYDICIRAKIDYKTLTRMAFCEIMIHQLLAVFFVGTGMGFQYIFLGMACPILSASFDPDYKRKNLLSSVISLSLFSLVILADNYDFYLPKYLVSKNVEVVSTIVMIFIVFLAVDIWIHRMYSQSESLLIVQKENELALNTAYLERQDDIIRGIAEIIEDRDESTGQHIMRTSNYAMAIANEMAKLPKYRNEISAKMLMHLPTAASLHDIGKIKTPDSILLKKGRLTPEEYDVIKKHTFEGNAMIDRIFSNIDDPDYVKLVNDVVMYHHERWDGTGYPKRLSGEEIPLFARIVAVADVFDALTSKRSYKDAYDRELAIDIIRNERGNQFDPAVVDAFLGIIDDM